jgi:hypothetical protein
MKKQERKIREEDIFHFGIWGDTHTYIIWQGNLTQFFDYKHFSQVNSIAYSCYCYWLSYHITIIFKILLLHNILCALIL